MRFGRDTETTDLNSLLYDELNNKQYGGQDRENRRACLTVGFSAGFSSGMHSQDLIWRAKLKATIRDVNLSISRKRKNSLSVEKEQEVINYLKHLEEQQND